MIRHTGVALIALLLGVSSVQAKVLGTFGMTYRIAERDALTESRNGPGRWTGTRCWTSARSRTTRAAGPGASAACEAEQELPG